MWHIFALSSKNSIFWFLCHLHFIFRKQFSSLGSLNFLANECSQANSCQTKWKKVQFWVLTTKRCSAALWYAKTGGSILLAFFLRANKSDRFICRYALPLMDPISRHVGHNILVSIKSLLAIGYFEKTLVFFSWWYHRIPFKFFSANQINFCCLAIFHFLLMPTLGRFICGHMI